MSKIVVSRSALMIAAAVAGVAVIFSLLLFVRPQEEPPAAVNYNGFEFVNVSGLWRTSWERDGQLYELDFRFNPYEVLDVEVEGSVDERFQFERVYLTIDPTEERTPQTAYLSLAAVELSRKLIDPFEREVIAACTRNETEACSNRPIISCGSTNSSIIYLKEASETKILLYGNCVTFRGSGDDLVRAVDRALFEWLGII